MERSRITEDLMVYAKGDRGTTGPLVGTVDHLEGDYIKLKRRYSPDHRHHWIPVDWVSTIDEHTVRLNRTNREVHQGMLNESPNEQAA